MSTDSTTRETTVTFAEGEVVDNAGKIVATASGSLLIFLLETA